MKLVDLRRLRLRRSTLCTKPQGLLTLALMVLVSSPGSAQLVDQTQSPNTENEGIAKSLAEQVGAGQGDVLTPLSSRYIIARDPFRSIRRGRQLFQRKFAISQGLGPRTGDGVGDIDSDLSLGAGLSDSCASCHGRPRGAAGFGGDVVTRPDSRDAPHLFGLGIQEMLADEMTGELRRARSQFLAQAQAENRPIRKRLKAKGVRFGWLTAHPDGTVDTSEVDGVDPDLRVRPFFAEGSTISIREFVVGAFNAEMGLEAPDPLLAAAVGGAQVVTPSGMVLDGATDRIEGPPVTGPGDDSDGDGVVNEIDTALIDHMEFYLLNYFKPAVHEQDPFVREGRRQLDFMGCTECHRPSFTIEKDRRVADVDTTFDPTAAGFNRLFATAEGKFDEIDDGSGFPALRSPQGGSFRVDDIFTDFKRHDLGPGFWERNYDGTLVKEFLTEPLWGVGSTAPYGHDGRSVNLTEVILRHGGEAESSRNRFAHAPPEVRMMVLAYLNSLVLFPPDDTASNLNPGDPSHPDFPQRGHGSIALGALFLDPTDIE